jgi:hypothetical protein
MQIISTIASQYGPYTITDETEVAANFGEIVVTGPLDHIGTMGTLCTMRYLLTQAIAPINPTVSEIYWQAQLTNAVAVINRKIQDISETVSRNVQIEIRDIQADIRDDVDTIKDAHNDIRDDIRALKIRGVDENLGIVTHETCEPCENGFYGALVRNAVVQSKQVQNVRDEYYHPTNIVPGA